MVTEQAHQGLCWRRMVSRRRWLWLLLLALATGAACPLLSRLMNANERPRLLQAIAIVDHGSIALDAVVARGIDPGIDVARGLDGRLLPNKPPGATLPAVVAYGALRLVAAAGGPTPTLFALTWSSRLLGAWLPTMLLAWSIARRLGGDDRARAAATLVIVSTPMLSYAHVLFGHSLAALSLWIGVLSIHDALHDDRAARARRHAVFGGFVAAFAVVVEYGAIVAAIPLAAMLWPALRDHRRATAWAAVAGAVVPMLALAGYHQLAFGSPWSTGYHRVVDEGFATIHGHGLLGFTWPHAAQLVEDLVSPWGGLLYWAPLVVFVPLAWRTPDQAGVPMRTMTWIFVAFLVLTLGLEQAGGWRVGPRYLVAALPMLAPALVVVLRRLRGREGALALLLGAAVFATACNALAANLFPHLVPDGNPLRDLLIPLVWRGMHPHGIVPFADVVGVLAALGALGFVLTASVPAGRRAAVGGASLVVAGIVAAVAWSLPSADDADATLTSIVAIWEPDGAREPKRVPLGEAITPPSR